MSKSSQGYIVFQPRQRQKIVSGCEPSLGDLMDLPVELAHWLLPFENVGDIDEGHESVVKIIQPTGQRKEADDKMEIKVVLSRTRRKQDNQ